MPHRFEDVTIPHLAVPFEIGPDGSARVVEQDTIEEIAQNVEVIITTVEGERLEIPEFGIAELAFQTDVSEPELRAEIERWEPRADVVISDAPNAVRQLAYDIEVRVTERT